jgi:tetratricopeptide (TPR) repeat protein
LNQPAPSPALEPYRCLVGRADAAQNQGDLETALALYTDAWQWAAANGDAELVDRALCNRCSPAIELGAWEEPARELRGLLLRSTDSEARLKASYHLARAYELRKEYRKALFYARAARQHSAETQQQLWEAASLNQTGNLLLAETQLPAALEAYQQALAAMPEGNPVWRARVLDNLGYCRVLQGRLREGFTLLLRSLRTLRRLGARRFEVSTRLDLCFAYLEAGRYRRAVQHGEVALAAAEEFNDADSLKNALYLLGEAANLAGDSARARALFGRLQRDYFPDNRFVSDFLLAVDVRKMVNLRA